MAPFFFAGNTAYCFVNEINSYINNVPCTCTKIVTYDTCHN